MVVEGINRVWKHVKPSQRNPQGGRIQKDAPIHMSNVHAGRPDDRQRHPREVRGARTARSTASPSAAAPTWAPSGKQVNAVASRQRATAE